MKKDNFVSDLGKSVNVDNNIKELVEKNRDPDIGLGMVAREVVLVRHQWDNASPKKNKELRIDEETSEESQSLPKKISNSIPKIVIPAVATVVVASLGVIPGLDGLNLFNYNSNTSIVSNVEQSEPSDIVFDYRLLDYTKTFEITDFADTRMDNNKHVKINTIAPGTSGAFMVEIDTNRNGSFNNL